MTFPLIRLATITAALLFVAGATQAQSSGSTTGGAGASRTVSGSGTHQGASPTDGRTAPMGAGANANSVNKTAAANGEGPATVSNAASSNIRGEGGAPVHPKQPSSNKVSGVKSSQN